MATRNLARKRKALGLTQHALAEASGVPVSRITYSETGRLRLTDEELEKISEVFKARAQRVFDAVFVG